MFGYRDGDQFWLLSLWHGDCGRRRLDSCHEKGFRHRRRRDTGHQQDDGYKGFRTFSHGFLNGVGNPALK